MTYATLKSKIGKGKFDPAYFFHGDNQFLIDELVEAISGAVVAPGSTSFDRNVLYGDEVDAAGLMNASTRVDQLGQ